MRSQSLLMSFAGAVVLSATAFGSSLTVQTATSYVGTDECDHTCDALVEGPCLLLCELQNRNVVEFATANVAVTPISITTSATADAVTLGGKMMAHAHSGFDVQFTLSEATFVYVEWNIFFPVAQNNILPPPPFPPEGIWVGQVPAGDYFAKADHGVVGEGSQASGIFIRVIPDYFADCDGDGTFDWQEIVSGTQQDTNENGIPDACEVTGDLNGDGLVGASDLAILLGDWSGSGPSDLNGDGSVGAADLAILLGAWS